MVIREAMNLSPILSLDKEWEPESALDTPGARDLSHAALRSERSPALFAGAGAGESPSFQRARLWSVRLRHEGGDLTLPAPAHRHKKSRGREQEKEQGANVLAVASETSRRAGSFGALAMLAAIAASAAVTIAGCAAGAGSAPAVRPLMVQVPVLHETACPAPTLTDPALPLASLKPDSPPADTMRAYAAAVAILKGAVRERDAVLAGCTHAGHPAAQPQAENTQ